jgi:hypothetical protein
VNGQLHGQGRPFLSHIDNDWGVCVFSTDGTFKSRPPPYEQFVTIHSLCHGRVLPCVMALATGKTVGHYRQILQHVKVRMCNITGHRFSPRMAICDFEQSLRIAFDTELPRTRVRNCYFHFCQSLCRRLQELALAIPYSRHIHIQTCIQKVMAIAYLPVAIVRQNFRLLLNNRRTRRLIQRFPALQDFFTYLQRNYMPQWMVSFLFPSGTSTKGMLTLEPTIT